MSYWIVMILEYDKNELANFSLINVQGVQLTKDSLS